MSYRVLLADDHRIVREALRAGVESAQDIRVVAEVSNGLEAVRAATTQDLDAVIMDIGMPVMNGIEAAEAVLRSRPELPVILLSICSDEEHVCRAFRAGVRGYLLKTDALAELDRALRHVVGGERYLSSAIPGVMIDAHGRPTQEVPTPQLSLRERQIVQMLAEGYSSAEIAAVLDLATTTVETHRKHIMAKLRVGGIASLTRYAIRMGLASLEE